MRSLHSLDVNVNIPPTLGILLHNEVTLHKSFASPSLYHLQDEKFCHELVLSSSYPSIMKNRNLRIKYFYTWYSVKMVQTTNSKWSNEAEPVWYEILANIWQFSRHEPHKKLISLDSFDTTLFVLTSYFINETLKY